MKSNVVVATHHKTGTVWMATVFRSIAKELGASFLNFWDHYGRLDRVLKTPFILFNHDSTFVQHADVLRRDDVRVLHLIRDPRDVLISAMHYHKTSSEAWLHQTVPGNEGADYQKKLNALASKHEQYLFEMENSTNSTIEEMLDWQYGRPNCMDVRYENLWQDRTMELWGQILVFLGFDEKEQALCKEAFWKHSLFGAAGNANRRHARSGEAQQWKHEFTPELAHAFVERFPEVLEELGYEEDDRWVEQLADARKAG
ncbi:hypothetical protein BH11PSE3_BH11PSE3_43540 [soil metagenome]